jgi:hypothetical protein
MVCGIQSVNFGFGTHASDFVFILTKFSYQNLLILICISGCTISVELEVVAGIECPSILLLASFLWNYT